VSAAVFTPGGRRAPLGDMSYYGFETTLDSQDFHWEKTASRLALETATHREVRVSSWTLRVIKVSNLFRRRTASRFQG